MFFVSRAICDDVFQEIEESEKIYKFSSPKVLRLVEIIRSFKPKYQKAKPVSIINETEDLPSMSVQSVQKNISEKLNSVVELNSKSTNETEILPNLLAQVVHERVSDKSNYVVELNGNTINETEVTSGSTETVHENIIEKSSSVVEANSKSINDTDTFPILFAQVLHENVSEKSSSVLEVNGQSVNETETLSSLSAKVVDGNIIEELSSVEVSDKSLNETETVLHDKISDKSNTVVDGYEPNGKLEDKNHLVCKNDESQPLVEAKHSEDIQPVNSENISNDNAIEVVTNTVMNKVKNININDENNIVSVRKPADDVDKSFNLKNIGLQTTISNTAILNNDETISKKLNQEDSGVAGKSSRFRGKARGSKFQKKGFTPFRSSRTGLLEDGENLCAIIFVEDPFTAKMLFHLLNVSSLCLFKTK